MAILSTKLRQNGVKRRKCIAGRYEMPVHQRPGVVGATGSQAGDEAAKKDLQQGHDKDQRREAALPRFGAFTGALGASEVAIQTSAAKVSDARSR